MFARTWRLSLVATSALVFALASGNASAQCLTIEKVKAKNGWDLVMELPDFEPYWFMGKDNKFAGMDVDLLNEVNKKLGITAVRYTTIPWEGVMPATLAKKSDFLPEAIIPNDERKKSFAFGHPYGDVSVTILTRPDTGIKSNKDFAGKTVAVQTGSGGEATLRKVHERYKSEGKDFTVKAYQGTADELLDLGNKRVDAVVASAPVLAVYSQKHKGKFVSAGLLDQALYGSWVYRKEDLGPAGCIGTEIDKTLSQLRKEGVLATLQKKWFGEEAKLPPY